jgi:hypothetical protein
MAQHLFHGIVFIRFPRSEQDFIILHYTFAVGGITVIFLSFRH